MEENPLEVFEGLTKSKHITFLHKFDARFVQLFSMIKHIALHIILSCDLPILKSDFFYGPNSWLTFR